MWEQMAASHSKGIEALFLSSGFRPVNNLGGFHEIMHLFLGEGSPEKVPAQVFHSGLILGKYPLPAEDLESGMPPVGEHGDQVFGNPPLRQEHLEELVAEDRLRPFQVQRMSDPKHALPVEASIRHQDMTVGIESQQVAKGLDGDDGAGNLVARSPLWRRRRADRRSPRRVRCP